MVRRGDVTLWFSPTAVWTWEPAPAGARRGRPKSSNLAIETALTLRLLFHLPLRQTEGFLTSLFGIVGLDLSVSGSHHAFTTQSVVAIEKSLQPRMEEASRDSRRLVRPLQACHRVPLQALRRPQEEDQRQG